MNAPTSIQIIKDSAGKPAFVVVPYKQYFRRYKRDHNLIPNDVVGKVVMDEMTPARAWREYLGLTQSEVAKRAGMTQAALSQIESGAHKVRKATRTKLAEALGITVEQLA